MFAEYKIFFLEILYLLSLKIKEYPCFCKQSLVFTLAAEIVLKGTAVYFIIFLQ